MNRLVERIERILDGEGNTCFGEIEPLLREAAAELRKTSSDAKSGMKRLKRAEPKPLFTRREYARLGAAIEQVEAAFRRLNPDS